MTSADPFYAYTGDRLVESRHLKFHPVRSTRQWEEREDYLVFEHEAAAKRIADLEYANSRLRQDIIDNDKEYKLDKTELEMRLASAMAAGRWWTGAMMVLGAVVWEVVRHFFGLGSWG